jgi:hypothetical protein
MGMSDLGSPSLISNRERDPDKRRMLMARHWRWTVATRLQCWQIALVLTAPLLAIMVGIPLPGARPLISFLAVAATMVDVTLVDRRYRAALKAAASASELFDTSLLKLPWNSLAAGKPPRPEEIDGAARRWAQKAGTEQPEPWYAVEVDAAPMGFARVVCQRTNLTYDSDLRRLYVRFLDAFAAFVGLVVLVAGLASSARFGDFVLTVWVPAAPILTWTLRERFRQADAIAGNDPVIAAAEALLEDMIAERCEADDCERRSRALQDSIFLRRSSTVLLFPGIYHLQRPDAERDMRAAARYWIERAGYAVPPAM